MNRCILRTKVFIYRRCRIRILGVLGNAIWSRVNENRFGHATVDTLFQDLFLITAVAEFNRRFPTRFRSVLKAKEQTLANSEPAAIRRISRLVVCES